MQADFCVELWPHGLNSPEPPTETEQGDEESKHRAPEIVDQKGSVQLDRLEVPSIVGEFTRVDTVRKENNATQADKKAAVGEEHVELAQCVPFAYLCYLG